jgi:hypothetical protein
MEGIGLVERVVDVRQPSQDALSALPGALDVDSDGNGLWAGIGNDEVAGYQMLMAAWKIMEITRMACDKCGTCGGGLQHASGKCKKGHPPHGRLVGARTKQEFEAVVCEIVAARKVALHMGAAPTLQAARPA